MPCLTGRALAVLTILSARASDLTMTFPPAAYPGLLTVTLAVQGAFGFIAWPLLTQVKPFGADPSTGNIILIGAPTLLLYAWPVLQGKDDRRRALRLGMVSASRGTADASLLADPAPVCCNSLSDRGSDLAPPVVNGPVVPLTAPVTAS